MYLHLDVVDLVPDVGDGGAQSVAVLFRLGRLGVLPRRRATHLLQLLASSVHEQRRLFVTRELFSVVSAITVKPAITNLTIPNVN